MAPKRTERDDKQKHNWNWMQIATKQRFPDLKGALDRIDRKQTMATYKRPQKRMKRNPDAQSSNNGIEALLSSSAATTTTDGPASQWGTFEQYLQLVEETTPVRTENPWRKQLLKRLCSDNTPNAGLMAKLCGKCPGPLPETLQKRNLSYLCEHKYWVAEKSDGLRVLLWIKPHGDDKGVYFIDRSFDYYRCEAAEPLLRVFDKELMFDGELLDLPGGFVYAMFDVIICGDDSSIHMKNYEERLRTCASFRRMYDESDTALKQSLPLSLRTKRTLLSYDMFHIIKNVKRSGDAPPYKYEYNDEKRGVANGNDGLIFTPEDNVYMMNKTTLPLLKWKWSDLNTVDFEIRKPWIDTHERLELHLGGFNQAVTHIPVGPANVDQIQALIAHITENMKRESMVVECFYHDTNGIWQIKNLRPDKARANYLTIGFATMEAIADGITKETLQALSYYRGSSNGSNE